MTEKIKGEIEGIRQGRIEPRAAQEHRASVAGCTAAISVTGLARDVWGFAGGYYGAHFLM